MKIILILISFLNLFSFWTSFADLDLNNTGKESDEIIITVYEDKRCW